jgi:hypothetical protein
LFWSTNMTLEERSAARVAGRLDRLDDVLQRQLLVLVGTQGDLPHAAEELAEGGVAGEVVRSASMLTK